MYKRIFYILYICFIGSLLLSCVGNYYNVTTSAMEPNIMVGDKVCISKQSQYTYGDVVLVEINTLEFIIQGMPEDTKPEKQFRIYRIVGLPNDAIEIQDNFCTINNKHSQKQVIKKLLDSDGFNVEKVEETLSMGLKIMLYVGEQHSDFPNNMNAKIIPKNEYFVLGDYRTTSLDSRIIGSIPIDKIKGKVVKIVKGE